MILNLEKQDISRLLEEAAQAFPAECCGLLIGSGKDQIMVTAVVPTANLSDDPGRFLIDPQCQFDWLRKLRGTEHRIVGHYHSHPNGLDRPSSHDEQMAADSEQIWVIIPVKDGVSGEPKGYRLKGANLGFEGIPIVEVASPY